MTDFNAGVVTGTIVMRSMVLPGPPMSSAGRRLVRSCSRDDEEAAVDTVALVRLP
jgi:hypothetical protein